jgi:hypothetical protein
VYFPPSDFHLYLLTVNSADETKQTDLCRRDITESEDTPIYTQVTRLSSLLTLSTLVQVQECTSEASTRRRGDCYGKKICQTAPSNIALHLGIFRDRMFH